MKKLVCSLAMSQFVGDNLRSQNIPFEVEIESFSRITVIIEDKHLGAALKICNGWF